MDFEKYLEAVSQFIRTDEQSDAPFEHDLLRLMGEMGEVLEIFKKVKYQGGGLNKQHLLDKIGDVYYCLVSWETSWSRTTREIRLNTDLTILYMWRRELRTFGKYGIIRDIEVMYKKLTGEKLDWSPVLQNHIDKLSKRHPEILK